jgi:transposase
MTRPYSNDLRERVALAVVSGRKCREVAALFQVSVASVVKWSQRYRATGTAAAAKMGGHRKRLLEPHRDLVLERMMAKPDMTIRDLVAELAEHGIMTTPVTAWRMVRSTGLRFKKNTVRHRAAAAGDRSTARAVEEVSGPA